GASRARRRERSGPSCARSPSRGTAYVRAHRSPGTSGLHGRFGAYRVAATETVSDRVRLPEQRKRVCLLRLAFADSLLDVTGGDGTVRADVVRVGLRHLAKHRTADFHRVLVVLRLDAPGPVMARAALDRVERRSGHELQRFTRFLAHVLDSR